MPEHPLQILAEALAEIASARAWYEARNPRAAADFMAEIDEAIEQIIHSPRRWPTSIAGTRRYPLRGFPYAVVYLQAGDAIRIVAVAHGSRRPGYWRDRPGD
jgi:plasmid stabilization system protein ParE